MLYGDRRPNNTDSDEYIKRWAIDNGLDKYPVAYISLISVCKDQPDTASINWLMPDQPITRYDTIGTDYSTPVNQGD